MSYLILARKYRPQDFSSVVGQEHVTRTLANAIKRDKVSQAYLFCGPRGVGKTSIARIFSKALNCEKGPTATPCLKCTNCQEIAQGISLAVREIDGASHNSVDNVRELIESFRSLAPSGSRYKIYIIDEVHMLSSAAFNALLKSLEEPPAHTVFILATTEAHKIPETVISRCQRYDLRAMSGIEVEKCLQHIAKQEKIQIEQEALRMIARYSDGSLRDAQSVLDRMQSFCDGAISAADVSQVLGSVEKRVLMLLTQSVLQHDSAEVLRLLSTVFASGVDTAIFLRELVSHWRDLLVLRFGGAAAAASLGLSKEDCSELQEQISAVSAIDIQDLFHMLREGADFAIRSVYPKYAIEALLVRMALREEVKDLAQLIGSQAQVGKVNAKHTAPVAQARPAAATKKSESISHAVSPAAAKSLDFAELVLSLEKHGMSPLFLEQLKRLAVLKLEPGMLSAKGPDFCIKYLNQKANKQILQDLLLKIYPELKWQLEFIIAEGADAADNLSLAAKQAEQEAQVRRQSRESVSNHPKVKSLQKVFQGSKIQEIR